MRPPNMMTPALHTPTSIVVVLAFAASLASGCAEVLEPPEPALGMAEQAQAYDEVRSLAMGWEHTCAIRYDGTVRCWGGNDNGQLGNGTSGQEVHQPGTDVREGNATLRNVTALASGGYHTCALIADGTVRCWGENTWGQLGNNGYTSINSSAVTVTGLDHVIALTAGWNHTCALSNELLLNRVRCWGRNHHGQLGDDTWEDSRVPVDVQLPPPSGNSEGYLPEGVTGLSAGGHHTCVSLFDGTAWCWGANDRGQLGHGDVGERGSPVRVLGVSRVVSVAAGHQHTCALSADGRVDCWGDNRYGQLGGHTGSFSAHRIRPANLATLTSVTSLVAGNDHTCGLRSLGRVYCWGDDYFHQLGRGTSSIALDKPAAVAGLWSVTAIGAGFHHGCAQLSDGSLQCWGDNYAGQLGDGSDATRTQPVAVLGFGLGTGYHLAAGAEHTCASFPDGTARCWGSSQSGQLGNGSKNNASLPQTVSLSNIESMAAGDNHSCAVLADGTARCWGYNRYGQLGNNSTTNSPVPVTVSGLSTVSAVGAGERHSCALLGDGTVRCWGDNSFSQLGNGSSPTTTPTSPIPVTVTGLSDVTALSVGFRHTCALRQTGRVLCWGYNASGQLGDSSGSNQNLPVEVIFLPRNAAVAIGAGGSHSCAVDDRGGVRCWGGDDYGQLGLNSPQEVTGTADFWDATAVALGASHTCALRSDGTVECWGANWAGQLGDGSQTDRSDPAPVAGSAAVIELEAGTSHTCAIVANGTARCWGKNASGQLGDGSTTMRPSPVPVAQFQ